MNLYGHKQNADELLSLNDVTIQASPEELRNTAEFLLHCANSIEKDSSWEHEHLNDYLKTGDASSDIVVFAQ